MFDHEMFDRYEHSEMPLDRDTYLVDECYSADYENMWHGIMASGMFRPIGLVSFVAVHGIREHTIELFWYPNIHDRLHADLDITRDRSSRYQKIATTPGKASLQKRQRPREAGIRSVLRRRYQLSTSDHAVMSTKASTHQIGSGCSRATFQAL